MIAFSNVVARYPHRVLPALDGVSFTAPRGELTAVVGPNGSGKSTLVRALIGRVELSAGSIDVDGTSIGSGSRRALATRVAVVTQREEPSLPLSVRDYVSLGRYPHLGLWRGRTAADVAAVDAAIEATETRREPSRSCRAANGSGCGSRARSRRGATPSCSTNRPPFSTSDTRWRCSSCSAVWQRKGAPCCS
jgi:iron complex transport system ATP-binding protein